jgi:hypothetical protein
MKLKETDLNCQVPHLQVISEGRAKMPPESALLRAKVFVLRHFPPAWERALKRITNKWMNRAAVLSGGETKPNIDLATLAPAQPFQPGDWVKVRSLEEIQATLNHWNQVKGCGFMPEMAAYCGTVQRVLKPMTRFVDERNLTVKKASGIVLLDRVMCQGTAGFGHCDRSCFFFWREEWLEKIGAPADREQRDPRVNGTEAIVFVRELIGS